jgi:AraC-like DNA-binding protein/dihydrodipicolinate synthase/N-acetylneuraminate lyase
MLFEQTHARPGFRAAVVGLALQLLGVLCRDRPRRKTRPAPDPPASDSLAAVRGYVADLPQRFFEPTDLDRTAAALGMSRRRFTQLFREITGETWLDHLTGLRIGYACELLRATTRSRSRPGLKTCRAFTGRSRSGPGPRRTNGGRPTGSPLPDPRTRIAPTAKPFSAESGILRGDTFFDGGPPMPEPPIDPLAMIRPRRKITGISAILLPFTESGDIDWPGFTAHVIRTSKAGLTPAVNMDTGFGNLLDESTKLAALDYTRSALGGRPFVAGAFVADRPGAAFDLAAYQRGIDPIIARGGTPVVFQSYGLTGQEDPDIVAAYEAIGRGCDGFIGFELGTMFALFGKVYSLDVYRGLLGVSRCLGAKHSSLNREMEWQRIRLRDTVRPDFKVYTGNDLAIDMVMYGSDYLLGLSTFAPDLFAKRDAMWAAGEPGFYELNDALQYLGFFAFRNPVPAYKHSAAMFLKLRGWIGCDHTHPKSPTRPAADRDVLRDIARLLEIPAEG